MSPSHQEDTWQVESSGDPILVNENDVLFGRGGNNSKHTGNKKLRAIAKTQKLVYKRASKKEKSEISRSIVAHIRGLSPPGRFLKKHAVTGKWIDVGDDLAREKTSQALRDAECDSPSQLCYQEVSTSSIDACGGNSSASMMHGHDLARHTLKHSSDLTQDSQPRLFFSGEDANSTERNMDKAWRWEPEPVPTLACPRNSHTHRPMSPPILAPVARPFQEHWSHAWTRHSSVHKSGRNENRYAPWDSASHSRLESSRLHMQSSMTIKRRSMLYQHNAEHSTIWGSAKGKQHASFCIKGGAKVSSVPHNAHRAAPKVPQEGRSNIGIGGTPTPYNIFSPQTHYPPPNVTPSTRSIASNSNFDNRARRSHASPQADPNDDIPDVDLFDGDLVHELWGESDEIDSVAWKR